jgi:fucose permease
MSWLHCFWGVGTVVSPYIMSYALGTELGWAGGYRIVGGIQIGILVILLATLPVWKKVGHTVSTASVEEEPRRSVGLIGSLKIKGVPYVLLGFLGYCAAESTVMVWASTYFFEAKSTTEEVAAALGSLFFIGMTVGRFLAGFISNRIGDKNMIRIGLGISAVGVVIIAIPSTLPLAIAGFLLIGLGFAPIYPSIIHSTPNSFGKENSQAIIGIQMAAAYLGATLAPPIFGLIANYVEIRLLPLYLATFMVISLVMLELLNKQGDARNLT